jgi:hypothetical protein
MGDREKSLFQEKNGGEDGFTIRAGITLPELREELQKSHSIL